MAEIVHVSQNTYSRYENGTISVPIEVLIELARFHNTSIDYLVNLTDIK